MLDEKSEKNYFISKLNLSENSKEEIEFQVQPGL
jgi:hypothetical protein